MEDDLRQHLEARQFPAAFELVVARFQDKVFRLAFSMTRNAALAEDLAQESLLRIWKGLPGYHGGASLSTWIYTITRNTCLTELKRLALRPTVSLDVPEVELATEHLPEFQSTDRPTAGDLDIQVMLDRLPEKYRQVLTLFYLEQKSYEEVAAQLDLPMGTVKTFLYRARQELLKMNTRPEMLCV